jgi:hypothetical protein
MSVQVATSLLRFQFVKGQLTDDPDDGFAACGDGTIAPFKVTLSQLEEIIYRARDGWFVSGKVSYGATEFVEIANSPPSGDRLAKRVDFGDGFFTQWERAYSTRSSINESNLRFFSDEYNVGALNYRDAISEYALWVPQSPVSGLNHFVSSRPISDFSTESYDLSGEYGAGGLVGPFGGNAVSLSFFPFAAYTGESIFDESGDIYLFGVFEVFGRFDFRNALVSYSYDSEFEEELVQSDIKLKISLSENSNIEIPLYRSPNFPTPSGSDFVFEATKWWPYAGTWNPTTGARA